MDAMEIRVQIQKVLIFTMKTSYRSACDHPFILGMLCFFIFLYKYLPSLFFFLVSSSPVIICTTVLLGTLLSFGHPYIPEIYDEDDEEEDVIRNTRHQISSLRSEGVGESELVVENEESFAVESHVDTSRGIEVKELNEKDLIFSEQVHDDGFVSSTSYVILEGAKLVMDELEEEKPLIGGKYDVEAEKEIEGEEVEDFSAVRYSAISKGEEESEESSDYDSDSDGAESSSPDASLADIMPMLDELHPLLDTESSQTAHISIDDDVGLVRSHGSNDGSGDEIEHAETEDEEEQQGGKDDGTEAVVTWTKEDEKNLMDLGNSELERNRRLESLIARRRARKNFRVMMTEKNLIDLDGGDPPFSIAPISTARRNPFDLHYDSNEGMDLPPIPGSAPSIMARRNPFDIPYDPLEERPNLAGGSFEEEFFTGHEKDFRRYETFNLGSSFLGEPKQEMPRSKFRPFFVPEQVQSEGTSYPTFQRQTSEISESKMSFVTETESISSASDHDTDKNLIPQELSQPIRHVEQELSQPMPYAEGAPELVKLGSSSSEEVDLAEIDEEYHGDADAEEQNGHERESISLEMESIASPTESIVTDVYMKPEVIEEKQTGLGSSSSAEVNDVIFHEDTSEDVMNQEPKGDDTIADNSTQPSGLESSLRSEVEETDDSHAKEPVYDWSPSEMEKTLSGIAIIEEALSYVDKRVVTSTSSLVSDMPMEAVEVGSTPVQVERTISSVNEELLPPKGCIREETASGSDGNDADLYAPVAPSVTKDVPYGSVSSLSQTEFEDKSSVSKEADVGQDPFHMVVPHSTVDVLDPEAPGVPFEDSTHIVSQMSPPLLEKTIVHSSASTDHAEPQEPSSPGSVSNSEGIAVDDYSEVVQEDNGNELLNQFALVSSPALISSEISHKHPTTREMHYEDDQYDEIQNITYSEVFEHSSGSQVDTGVEVTDKDFNVVEEINEIDEGLLTELDAVGDFGVHEIDADTNQKENLVIVEKQESLTNPQVLQAYSSEDVEGDSHSTQDSMEALIDPQDLESRSVEENQEMYSSPKKFSVDKMEEQLKITECEDGSVEVSAESLDSAIEVKSDFEELMDESIGAGVKESMTEAKETCEASSLSTTDESKKTTGLDAIGSFSIEELETHTNGTENVLVAEVEESLTEIDVLQADSSKDVEEDSRKIQEPMEMLLDTHDLEARSIEVQLIPEEPLVSNQLKPPECVDGSEETAVRVLELATEETAVRVLESATEVESDSKQYMAKDSRTSVKESNAEVKDEHEASGSSRTDGMEKAGPDAVRSFRDEQSETNTIQTDYVFVAGEQGTLTGVQVLENSSYNDVENGSYKTKDSVEASASSLGIEERLEGEKLISVYKLDDQLITAESEEPLCEIIDKVKESSIEVKPDSEAFLAEETKPSFKESISEVEEA
ncbi:hypothetical protein IFM89_004584, partial [Coptis chinensis]